MNLREFMDIYPETERFRELFPGMYEFAEKIQVIPWEDRFAIADSEDESRGYVSRTLGICFQEDGKVSFRDSRPPFWVVVHELGHAYFSLRDETLWNASYAGAESIILLILEGKLEGDEKTVRKYISIRKLLTDNASRLNEILNKVAQSLGTRNIAEYCTNAETLLEGVKWGKFPDKLSDTNLQAVLHTMLEGTKYGDSFWSTFLKTLLQVEYDF